MNTDRRLTSLEASVAEEKLQSGTRLARLEALLEKMAQQLDRIELDVREKRN